MNNKRDSSGKFASHGDCRQPESVRRAKGRAWIKARPELNKGYQKKYYDKNSERIKAYGRAHKKIDSVRLRALETSRAWRAEHPESCAKWTRNWWLNHPGEGRALIAKRRASRIQRTPKWADLDAIAAIYMACERISQETGIEHHVDHEIPLTGRRVSGLHVHNNLRVIPASANRRKSNLFEEPRT